MTIQETFIRADEELKTVVDQIKDDQWDMKMPEGFTMNTKGAEIVTLRDVINYHAYDEAWIPDTVAGRTMEEIGADKFNGDLLGMTPKQNYAVLVEKATAAVRGLEDLERTMHFTYGDFPAKEALTHVTLFRGFRAHDLAKVIGVDSDLPAELVQALWDIVEPHAEEWRAIGVFGAKVDVPEDAPLQDRLLGLSGRQP